MKHACLFAAALTCVALASAALIAQPAAAQQTTVGTVFHGVGEGFTENIGVNWGFNFRNGFARFGGPAPAGAAGGLQFAGRAPGGFFNAWAAQGNHRNLMAQTPSVNGGGGFVADVTQRPFVMGVVPVVGSGGPVIGGFPVIGGLGGFGAGGAAMGQGMGQFRVAAPSPIQQRLARLRAEGIELGNHGAAAAADDPNVPPPPPRPAAPIARRVPNPGDVPDTLNADELPGELGPVGARLRAARNDSAGQAVPSVAELRIRRAAQDEASDRELAQYLEHARTAESSGKPGAARVYYRSALRRAHGALRQEIAERLATLDGK